MKKRLVSLMIVTIVLFSAISIGLSQTSDRPDLENRVTIWIVDNEIVKVFCTRPGSTCFKPLVITADKEEEEEIKN